MASPLTRFRPRIGRLDAWEALVYRRERARAGLAGITILDGPLGVGKSTFLGALIEDSRESGFHVFQARAATESPPPLSLIRAAVASGRPDEGDPSTSDSAPGSSLAFLPGLVRHGAESMSGEAIRTAADGTQAELESDRQRLFAGLAEPLFSMARKRPVLLALDDLHRSDVASLEFLEYLLPQTAGRPIWILGTLDSTEPRRGPGPLDDMLVNPEIERVQLPALSEGELVEFLHWLDPQRRFREPEVRRLYSETSGLPMFVERLVHHPSAGAGASSEERTASAEEAAQLRALDESTRRLLNLAVVAGNEFSFDIIAAAAGGDEEQVVEGLERLVGLGLLRELEWDRFAFTEEGLRHRLFAELPGPSVKNLHRRIAGAYEQSGSQEMETIYALARHAYLGGLDSAVQYNRRAAEFAVASFQPLVAVPYLEHALDALHRVDPEDVGTEIGLRLELAMQRTRGGELQTAETLLKEFRTDRRLWGAATPVDRAFYALLHARLLADEGRWEEAERSFRDLPPSGPSAGSVPLRIATLRLRGEILFYRGNYSESLATHDEALHLATEAGDEREAAAESIRRSTVLSMLPDREDEATAGFRQAVEKLVEVGDRGEAAFGLLCLGAQLNQQGRAVEARQALERAFALSEAARDLRRLGWTCLNLADLELGQGRHSDAEERNRVALALFVQIGDSLGRARAFLTQGRLALVRGDPAAAEPAFQAARKIFSEQDLKADELEVDLREVEVRMAQDDRAGALHGLEQVRVRGLERLRPDLVGDWRRLRDRLTAR